MNAPGMFLWLKEIPHVCIKSAFEYRAIAYVMHEVHLNVMFASV